MKAFIKITAVFLILLILIVVVAAAILTKGFTEEDPYDVKSQISGIIGGDKKPGDDKKPSEETPNADYTFAVEDSIALSDTSVGKPIYVNSDVKAYQALADYISSTRSYETLLYALTCESGATLLITAFLDSDTEYLNLAFKMFKDGQIMQDGQITEEGQFSIDKFAQWNTADGGWHDEVYIDRYKVKGGRVGLTYTPFFPMPDSKFTVANCESIEGLSQVISRAPADICNNILSITPFIQEV